MFFNDFPYIHKNQQQKPEKNSNRNKGGVEDSIYFIHGNSGDYGQARWMFSEFSKLFWEETVTTKTTNDKNDNTNNSDVVLAVEGTGDDAVAPAGGYDF